MAQNTKRRFKFTNPTYIVKAVADTMKSPQASYAWPKKGGVDDTANFKATTICGNGLYGYTLDQMRVTTDTAHYFKTNHHFLILEVEASELVLEDHKCKVPRCNVVACYESYNWRRFARKLHSLLNPPISVAELEEIVGQVSGFPATLAEVRRELKEWRKSFRIPGEGCASQAELDQFLKLREELKNFPQGTTPDQAKVNEVAAFMQTCTCGGAVMDLWSKLQRNTRFLFAIHPFIEKRMIALATDQPYGLEFKFPLKSYITFQGDPIGTKFRSINRMTRLKLEQILEMPPTLAA